MCKIYSKNVWKMWNQIYFIYFIPMEKLLELLNKHRVELAHWNLQNQLMRHYNGYVFWLWDLNSQNCVLLIISKEYWFIKWLVENEKIDFEKLREKYEWEFPIIYLEYTQELYSEYESLLMLLAIQDEPISFLISLLK